MTVLFVVLLPATVHAFDHHHHHSSGSGGGGCSSSSSSSSSSGGVSTTPVPAPTATAPAEMVVFVTSTTYSGALGSLEAADLDCQSSAAAAGLPGRYRAWLSDSSANAVDRITGDGPWYTTGGDVAFGSKLDLQGTPATKLLSENGGDALGPGASGPWTGTTADGVASGQDCDGWSNATADVAGTLGTAQQNDPSWGGAGPALACNAKAPLICFAVQ